MNRLRSQDGMTLVEISVVVAVIGILAAIAIPSFTTTMPRVRLGTVTRTLSNEIAMSRMAAISKSTWYQVAFDTAAHRYSLQQFTRNPDNTWTLKTSATTSLPAAVRIQSLQYLADLSTPPTSIIKFNANGTTDVPLAMQAIAVTLATADGLQKKRVVAEMTGRIYSQKWNGGPEAAATSWIED